MDPVSLVTSGEMGREGRDQKAVMLCLLLFLLQKLVLIFFFLGGNLKGRTFLSQFLLFLYMLCNIVGTAELH